MSNASDEAGVAGAARRRVRRGAEGAPYARRRSGGAPDQHSDLLFIFDMDDVLYDYDWRARMARLTELTGLSLEELWERWWVRFERAAEAGDPATGQDYLSGFNAALGTDISEDDWVAARAAAMTARPEALAAVARAAELGTVTLLTNNGALVHQHLGGALAPELKELFGEHLHASSAYSARKPDPVVFERVLERYGVPADRAFFADDLVENVEGAASIGITAHLYRNAAGLLAAIEDFAASRGVH
jgi:putative hydrolase of the HAD superfamily